MTFLKTLKAAIAAIATLAAFAFAAPASATCYGYNCNGNGNPPPPPAPQTSKFSFEINSGVGFLGMGAGSYTGSAGNIEVLKSGYGMSESGFDLGGNFCGVSCQSGHWFANGSAGEMVQVNGWAVGNNASVVNGGSAATMLQGSVTIKK